MASLHDPNGAGQPNSTSDTEVLLTDPSVGLRSVPSYKALPVTWSIILSLLLVVASEVSVFLLPFYCYKYTCNLSPLTTVCYTQCCLWFVFFLFDQYWRKCHNKSRTLGYLEFYRYTCVMRRIPVILISIGSVFLLLLMTLLYQYCKTETKKCPDKSPFKPIHYVQMVVSLQTVFSSIALMIYLVRVVQFNRRQDAPDIEKEESVLPSASSSAVDIGYRDDGYVDKVLEKQADMIRYLKQHNAQLGRKIVELTSKPDES